MKPNNCNYKKVHIQITTYSTKQTNKNMNHDREIAKSFVRSDGSAKFICSICLNAKPKCEDVTKLECTNRKSKSCPICQKDFNLRCEASNNHNPMQHKCEVNENLMIPCNQPAPNSKIIQTSETDVSHGLNLLNEVLTVFQSKKNFCVEKEKCTKTVFVKDASVETERLSFNQKNIQPKLAVSKVLLMSIDENAENAINRFTIVNSAQPRRNVNSQKSIDLIKHKSSSIPQMKLEELKNSLKEKTKSKDAIEEVNRMFATVRKNTLHEKLDDGNRPVIRNGPRVLPVVKASNKPYTSDGISTICQNNSNREIKKGDASNCRYCQTNNYLLSSGDSIAKTEYYQQKNNDNSKCVCPSRCHKCCHHSYNHCEHYCQRVINDGCNPDRCDNGQNDDSCPSF